MNGYDNHFPTKYNRKDCIVKCIAIVLFAKNFGIQYLIWSNHGMVKFLKLKAGKENMFTAYIYIYIYIYIYYRFLHSDYFVYMWLFWRKNNPLIYIYIYNPLIKDMGIVLWCHHNIKHHCNVEWLISVTLPYFILYVYY